MNDISKVVIGLSGGVDSAVAAHLLKNQGHDVTGVILRTGPWCDTCDAEKVAASLSIPFYAVDCAEEFKAQVTDPFVKDYLNGMTPNPCVLCNKAIKWSRLLEFADEIGAEYVATGHYARVVRTDSGRFTVKMSAAAAKDQTYMLYRLSQEHLARTVMPLSDLTKDEVRKIAKEARLEVAEKKDSQETCFVPDGHYVEFLRSYEFAGDDGPCRAKLPAPGNFVDEDGNILGQNKGIVYYTVGQRKGLGLALGYPAFVESIDAETGNVVVTHEKAVFKDRIFCTDLNFLSVEDIKPSEKMRAFVKIRYHHAAAPAYLERVDDNTVKVTFDEPVRAPAPGQSSVFYDAENRVIGGGIIKKKED